MQSFTATTQTGKPVEVEVYWDEQSGVEPGWCWRADKGNAGGDTIDGAEKDEPEWALTQAKMVWGV